MIVYTVAILCLNLATGYAESTVVSNLPTTNEVLYNSSSSTTTIDPSSSIAALKTAHDMFPSATEKAVKFGDNSALRYKITTQKINKTSKTTDSEVNDLRKIGGSTIKPLRNIMEPPKEFPQNQNDLIKSNVEWIENGENTEDTRRRNVTHATQAKTRTSDGPGVPLVQGQLAAILAGVFVSLAVFAYIGLLSWRRYLEYKYGNREMLVNEDDDPNDMRYFSL